MQARLREYHRRRAAQIAANAVAADIARRVESNRSADVSRAIPPETKATAVVGDGVTEPAVVQEAEKEPTIKEDTFMEKWHQFNRSNPWISPVAGILGGVGGFLVGGPAGALAGSALGTSLTAAPAAAHTMKALGEGDWGEAAKTGALEVLLPTLSVGATAAISQGLVRGTSAAASGIAGGAAKIAAAPGAAARAVRSGAQAAGEAIGRAGSAVAAGPASVARATGQALRQAGARARGSISSMRDWAGARLQRMQTLPKNIRGANTSRQLPNELSRINANPLGEIDGPELTFKTAGGEVRAGGAFASKNAYPNAAIQKLEDALAAPLDELDPFVPYIKPRGTPGSELASAASIYTDPARQARIQGGLFKEGMRMANLKQQIADARVARGLIEPDLTAKVGAGAGSGDAARRALEAVESGMSTAIQPNLTTATRRN